MTSINRIKDTLDNAPAQLAKARESADGTVAVPLQADNPQSRGFEARALARALEPLERSGWTVAPGPRDFRTGEFSHVVVTPPLEGVNTASLPVRDRVRVEGAVKPLKFRNPASDPVEALEVDETAGTVYVDTDGMSLSLARGVDQLIAALQRAGWYGEVVRKHGGGSMKATLKAPAAGVERTPGQIDYFLGK